MECIYLSCKKAACDSITCEKCSIPKYCSEECMMLDLERHSASCTPHIYSLRDFVPVKDSQKLLGSGAYGEVQLVQRKGTRELYAQKIYKKSMIAAMIPMKILFREISVHQTLIHPNIVRLYDHMEDHTKLYLIMEYVDKGTLYDLLHKKGKLSEREAWNIFTQTCLGLHYLHSKNILHRDLKPENLLISKTDAVKICDFGWSAHGTSERVTFCGTLDYMSPEMLNQLPQTYKVDVWAVGVLLYEMLHASPPFRAKNPKELSRLISQNNFPISPNLSNSVKSLISSLLQENPESRPTILEVLKSEWIQTFKQQRLKPNYKVLHPELGEGLIDSIQGLVVLINFNGSHKELIEDDLIKESTIENDQGETIFGKPEAEIESPVEKPAGKRGSVSSKSQKLLKTGNQSASRASRPLVFTSTEVPLKKLQIEEEEKKSSQILTKSLKTFENINLTPTATTAKPTVNKSRFLQRFKNPSK